MEDDEVVVGSGDFLADRGYPAPGETRRRFTLAAEIGVLAERLGLSPAAVGGVTGLEMTDVERILSGAVADYPTGRLAAALVALRAAGA